MKYKYGNKGEGSREGFSFSEMEHKIYTGFVFDGTEDLFITDTCLVGRHTDSLVDPLGDKPMI